MSYGTFWEMRSLWDVWHGIFERDNQWDNLEYLVSILVWHSQIYGRRLTVVGDQLRIETQFEQIPFVVDHILRSTFDSSTLGHHG